MEPPHDGQGRAFEDWIDKIGCGLWLVGPTPRHGPGSRLNSGPRSAGRKSRELRNIRAKNLPGTGNKWMDAYLASVKPFNSVAVLQKSQDKFSLNPLESNTLKGVPVIAPVGIWERQCEHLDREEKRKTRLPRAARGGHASSPGPERRGICPSAGGASPRTASGHPEHRAEEGMFTTYMTFAELLADYRHHHETNQLTTTERKLTATLAVRSPSTSKSDGIALHRQGVLFYMKNL